MSTTTERRQLAVSVAKDVIKSLNEYKAVLTSNSFVEADADSYEEDRNGNPRNVISKLVNKFKEDSKTTARRLKKHCEVCALGACFLSLVALTNEYTFELDGEYNTEVPVKDLFKKLRVCFSKKQMFLIESAFELGEGYTNERAGNAFATKEEYTKWASEYSNALIFGKAYVDVQHRLRAIMENIISNEGIFVPQQLPEDAYIY